MPCPCKVGCINHHMNTYFPNAIKPEKSLPGEGSWSEESLDGKCILGRKIFGCERFPGQSNLCPGKVSWDAKYLNRKGCWAEKSLPGKGVWEEFARL